MEVENDRPNTIDKKNWVINLSQKPLTVAERSLLEKGPKFAPTPQTIPVKDIVSEVEAAIVHLPDDTKDAYEPPPPPCSTEPDFHHTATPPKLN